MSRLSLLLAVVVSCLMAATVLGESDCFTCNKNGKFWCKTSSTCVLSSSECQQWEEVIRTISSCPGYNSDSPYQSCVPCTALANGYWCKWSYFSSINSDGFCATSSRFCPTTSIASVYSCPDNNWGSHSNCLSCTPTAYWCKAKTTSNDYQGTCVRFSSNCPSALTVSFPSGCSDYVPSGSGSGSSSSSSSSSDSAGTIIGLSVVVFVFLVIILPIAVTIFFVVLCVRAFRSRKVAVATVAPVAYTELRGPSHPTPNPQPKPQHPPMPAQQPTSPQAYQPPAFNQGYGVAMPPQHYAPAPAPFSPQYAPVPAHQQAPFSPQYAAAAPTYRQAPFSPQYAAAAPAHPHAPFSPQHSAAGNTAHQAPSSEFALAPPLVHQQGPYSPEYSPTAPSGKV